MRKVTRVIYQCQKKLCPIERFQFIEFIAGLFYLQINILKLFQGTPWDKKSDKISLACFQQAL